MQLSRAHMVVQNKIENALKAAKLPPLAWYDILLELDRLGAGGGRAYEVQARLLLPQYGLSRLLERLEKARYVSRKKSAEDGRGKLIFITAEGKKVRLEMWEIYRAALRSAIDDKLPETGKKPLMALLAQLQ